MDENARRQILGLSDVDLIRLLTVQAADQSQEVLAIASEEANRRGVPIDEAFIPADSPEAIGHARWKVGGVQLKCPHCSGMAFRSGRMLLNTRGMTLFGLDWLNRGAHTMECTACGLLQIFTMPPEPVPE